MGKEIRLMVTQPVHGSHGDLTHQVGDLFPLGAELGPDVRVTEVIVDIPDSPEGGPGEGETGTKDGAEVPSADGKPDAGDTSAAKPSPPPGRASASRGTRTSSP